MQAERGAKHSPGCALLINVRNDSELNSENFENIFCGVFRQSWKANVSDLAIKIVESDKKFRRSKIDRENLQRNDPLILRIVEIYSRKQIAKMRDHTFALNPKICILESTPPYAGRVGGAKHSQGFKFDVYKH